MNIRNLHVKGIGCISDLSVEFDPEINLICGANGVGKTTLLECAAHVFAHGLSKSLKSNVRSKSSTLKAVVWDGEKEVTSTSAFSVVDPITYPQLTGLHELAPKLIAIKTSRMLAYKHLTAIPGDTVKSGQSSAHAEAMNGVNASDVKAWLVRRYLFSGHVGDLNAQQLENFELGKEAFSFLDSAISFSRVDVNTNDVLVNTPNGEISYEFLSSGFKSSLILVLSIIKEIEYRFKEPFVFARKFDGVVTIDEIELHLHPEWQKRIIPALSKTFPHVQFIVTTHSPHVIQNAGTHQIVALGNKDGDVFQLDNISTKHGFQGWSVEEILIDVMGMRSTQSPFLDRTLNEFCTALDANNRASAEEAYLTLSELLHPNNELKKMLKLQLGSLD